MDLTEGGSGSLKARAAIPPPGRTTIVSGRVTYSDRRRGHGRAAGKRVRGPASSVDHDASTSGCRQRLRAWPVDDGRQQATVGGADARSVVFHGRRRRVWR